MTLGGVTPCSLVPSLCNNTLPPICSVVTEDKVSMFLCWVRIYLKNYMVSQNSQLRKFEILSWMCSEGTMYTIVLQQIENAFLLCVSYDSN